MILTFFQPFDFSIYLIYLAAYFVLKYLKKKCKEKKILSKKFFY